MPEPTDPSTTDEPGPAAPGDPHEPAVLASTGMKWLLLLYLVVWLGGISAAAWRLSVGGVREGASTAPETTARARNAEQREPGPLAVVTTAKGAGVAIAPADAPPPGAGPAPGKEGSSTNAKPPATSGEPGPPISGRRLWLLVALAGALGGTLHGLASLSTHTGKGTLYASWRTFYLARPFVGTGLAVVVGLILTSAVAGFRVEEGPRGTYTLLAWAAMAGLFAEPALHKLRDVFDALFRGGGGDTPQKPGAKPQGK